MTTEGEKNTVAAPVDDDAGVATARQPAGEPGGDDLPDGVAAAEVAASSDPGAPKALKIGDLALRTGKSVRALHLYEEMGLLTPVGRTTGRFRLYAPDAVLRVEWISKLQDLGFTLPQIRDVVGHMQGGASGD